MTITVYYEDTDTGGVVYHANYLNFCERARSEAFFNIGLTPELENGHFVASKLTAQYFKSAKLGDVLEIKNKLIRMKAASFEILQTVYKDSQKIFELEITLAYITFEGKPQKLEMDTKDLVISLFD